MHPFCHVLTYYGWETVFLSRTDSIFLRRMDDALAAHVHAVVASSLLPSSIAYSDSEPPRSSRAIWSASIPRSKGALLPSLFSLPGAAWFSTATAALCQHERPGHDSRKRRVSATRRCGGTAGTRLELGGPSSQAAPNGSWRVCRTRVALVREVGWSCLLPRVFCFASPLSPSPLSAVPPPRAAQLESAGPSGGSGERRCGLGPAWSGRYGAVCGAGVVRGGREGRHCSVRGALAHSSGASGVCSGNSSTRGAGRAAIGHGLADGS